MDGLVILIYVSCNMKAGDGSLGGLTHWMENNFYVISSNQIFFFNGYFVDSKYVPCITNNNL